MIRRGEIWWAQLGEPRGSEPGHRRPVLIVQADAFNDSRLGTTVVVALTSNLRRADAPGNVRLPRTDSGLPKDSVANVSQVVTIDKAVLTHRIRSLPPSRMRAVDEGLRLALAL